MTTHAPRPRRTALSLSEAAGVYWRQATPWMMAAMLVAALATRIALGNWQLTDLLVPLVLLALFPVIEWVIHVVVLHWRPRAVAGVTIDSRLARSHRAHHADPRDVPLVFIPWQTLAWVIPALVVGAVLAFPRLELALTYLVALSVAGLLYEWTHHLIHSTYIPRGRFYRAIWRHHRNHHFKNEHYWFTVTTAGTADRLFGTNPSPEAVATSPTARRLHAAG
jgi:hypothetical protein